VPLAPSTHPIDLQLILLALSLPHSPSFPHISCPSCPLYPQPTLLISNSHCLPSACLISHSFAHLSCPLYLLHPQPTPLISNSCCSPLAHLISPYFPYLSCPLCPQPTPLIFNLYYSPLVHPISSSFPHLSCPSPSTTSFTLPYVLHPQSHLSPFLVPSQPLSHPICPIFSCHLYFFYLKSTLFSHVIFVACILPFP
jgi:hypothetical protein